jgi:hypothetical protein
MTKRIGDAAYCLGILIVLAIALLFLPDSAFPLGIRSGVKGHTSSVRYFRPQAQHAGQQPAVLGPHVSFPALQM